jgi:hypothetical protein
MRRRQIRAARTRVIAGDFEFELARLVVGETTMRSRNGARGSRTGVIGNPLPTTAGVHLSMMIPLGTAKKDRRFAPVALSAADTNAGRIASSSGNANAVPAPRRKVRLGIAFLKTIMVSAPPSSETAHC